MNIDRDIKIALVEASEQKEKRLIQESLIKRRIMMIFESEENFKHFDLLPEKQQKKIGKNVLIELLILKNEIINEGEGEGLWRNLISIFGGLSSAVIQSIGEPFINSLLSKIGLPNGFVKNFLVSALTKNWGRLGRAIKGDCKEVTAILSESIIEALIMNLTQSKGMVGPGYVIIRNSLEEAIRGMGKSLEDKLMSQVCEFMDHLGDKVKSLVTNDNSENNPVMTT